MWDLIVSVPDHCLSFYLIHFNLFCKPSTVSENRTISSAYINLK